jgi:hypothetical protein
MRPRSPVLLLPLLVLCSVTTRAEDDAGEPDYYATLGVATDAGEAEIKKAYRALAKVWHPDKSTEPNAEETFVGIVEAYEVLSDPEQRTWYDNTRESGGRRKVFPRKSGSRGRSNFGAFGGFNVGGMNRLIFSSMMGDVRKVEKLLKAGRAPEGQPWNLDDAAFMGFTALHWACKKKQLKIATLLVEAGASVDAKLVAAPPGGNAKAGLQTPLMIAAKAGQEKIVQLLLANNADPTLKAGDGVSAPIDFACDEVQAATKRKPVPLAMRQYLANLKTIIRYLLEADAKRNPDAPALLPRSSTCLSQAGFDVSANFVGKPAQSPHHQHQRDTPRIVSDSSSQQKSKMSGATSVMDLSMFKRLILLDERRHALTDDKQLSDWFDALDANGDGGVDQTEFKSLASIVDSRKDELRRQL